MDELRELRRIPCHLDGICETIEGLPPTILACPARVVNLSISGACLSVDRQFPHGTMLFLKLPDPTKAFWCGRSAHVVHTKTRSPNVLLGCHFTAPLTVGELQTLVGQTPAPERRVHPRFVPSPETLKRLVVKLQDHEGPVLLNDISVGGICLVVKQPIAEPAQLQVELTNTANGCHCQAVLRLFHVRKSGTNWVLGGGFLEKIANQKLLTLLS